MIVQGTGHQGSSQLENNRSSSLSSIVRTEQNGSKLKKELQRKTVFKGVGMQAASQIKNLPITSFQSPFKNTRYVGGGFGKALQGEDLISESFPQQSSAQQYETLALNQTTINQINQSKESLQIYQSPSTKVFADFVAAGQAASMKNQSHTTNQLPKGAGGMQKLFLNTEKINQTSVGGDQQYNTVQQTSLPPLTRPSQGGSERLSQQNSPLTPAESGTSSAHNRLNQLMQYYGNGGMPAHISTLLSTNPFGKKQKEQMMKINKHSGEQTRNDVSIKRDWADALKREIQNQTSIDHTDSNQKINFSRFKQAPLIGPSGKLGPMSPQPHYPKQFSKMFPSTNMESGSVTRINTDPGDIDTLSSLRQNQTQPISNMHYYNDRSQYETLQQTQSKALVHHLLHEDLVETNKVDEIEKILLKKLIDNQPLTRITQFQKPRLYKSKMGTEKLIKLQRVQEQRMQKEEYQKEKMMQSVQYLFDQSSSSNVNMLSNPNMQSGVLPYQSPDSRFSSLGKQSKALLLNQDQYSAYKGSSASKPKLNSLKFEDQYLKNMRKTLLEQTPDLQAVGQELQPLPVQKSQSVMATENRQSQYSEMLRKKHQMQLRRSVDRADRQSSSHKNTMSVILEENQEITGPGAFKNFDKKIEDQSNVFNKTVEHIVTDSTFMRGYEEVEKNNHTSKATIYQADFEQKIANIDNHFDLYMTSLGDQMLTETKNAHEEYENSKVYNPHVNLKIHPNRYLKKKVVGNKFPKDAFSFGKAKINSPTHSSTKNEKFKVSSTPGSDSDPELFQDGDYSERKQHYFEELKKRQMLLRKAQNASSHDSKSTDGTRNLYFSSSKSSDILNNLGLERGDITNLKNTFMNNLRQMQLEFASQSEILGFTRQELTEILGQMIDQHLQQALKEQKIVFNHDDSSFIETQRTVTTDPGQNDPTKNLEFYQKIMYQTFSRVAQEIQGSLQFAQMNKNACFPELEERLENDPKFRYAKECRTQAVSVLPLLSRIKNKVLNLANYALTAGIAKSLGQSIKKNDQHFNKILMESNNMRDEDLASVLEGLHRLQDIKSITYNKNEFGLKSAEALKIIVGLRYIPYHLEELRLVNCKISPQSMSVFLDVLEDRNYIKRLALVNAQINDGNLKKIIPFIKSSRYLIELDLSWNTFRNKNLIEFFDAIGDNKQLQSLNISWNNLIDKSDMTPMRGGDPLSEIKPEEELREQMTKIQEKGAKLLPPVPNEAGVMPPKATKEATPLDPQELKLYIMAKITKFMKYNKNLLHLDLSNTGLNEQMVRTIATALKRSRSIVSLHLTGNPGVTAEAKEFLFERVRCCRPRPSIFTEPDSVNARPEHEEWSKMAIGALDKVINQSLEKTYNTNKTVNEGVEYTQVNKGKKIAQLTTDGLDERRMGNKDLANESTNKLVFQRYVGHKAEMPGSGQWQMLTEKHDYCWVCDKWIYGVVFWNPRVSNQTQIEIDYFEKTKIMEQIGLLNKNNQSTINENNNFLQQINSLANNDSQIQFAPTQVVEVKKVVEPSAPTIVGSFTNWQYRKMMTIQDFIKSIDRTPSEELVKQLKLNYLCRNEVKYEADLNEEELEYYRQVKAAHEKRSQKYWRHSLVKSLRFNKKPFLVNYEQLLKVQLQLTPRRVPKKPKAKKSNQENSDDYTQSSDEETKEVDASINTWVWDPHPYRPQYGRKKAPVVKEEEIWVLPVFMKAGKHPYFVKGIESDEYFAHQLLAPFRDEEIPIQQKISKTKTVERRFKKDTSVFRDWKEDNNYVLTKSAELDKKEWKAPRFIRDVDEIDRCWDIIWQNFSKLKDIFINLASKSNFPSVTNLDFTTFCDTCKMIDGKTFNLADIDRLFIATNVEIVANDENPDKELCRFEFFEILLRIGDFKYRQKGVCNTYSEALEKMVKDHVFAHYKPAPWQEFRDRELYTVEVNDVLEANLKGLQKVYEYFFDPRKKHMSMNDALDLMIKLTPLALTEKDAYFCYGMSKMTVINEAEESSIRYKRLQFVELLEMIGRIADVKFKGTELETTMTLAQRIEFVLDDVLSLVEVKRKDVNIVIDEQSESDDEY